MKESITKTAHELTLRFQEDSDIPSRFKKNKTKPNKKKTKDSLIEGRYQKHIQQWSETISSILQRVTDKEQAWRFIRIKPKLNANQIQSVTQCKDFVDFLEFLSQRRDKDQCGDDELGKLCMLITAFQREVESSINN